MLAFCVAPILVPGLLAAAAVAALTGVLPDPIAVTFDSSGRPKSFGGIGRHITGVAAGSAFLALACLLTVHIQWKFKDNAFSVKCAVAGFWMIEAMLLLYTAVQIVAAIGLHDAREAREPAWADPMLIVAPLAAVALFILAVRNRYPAERVRGPDRRSA